VARKKKTLARLVIWLAVAALWAVVIITGLRLYHYMQHLT
jgi:hypothetical protein